MLKAVFAKHVKEGDGLLLSGGKTVDVRVVGRHCGGVVDLLAIDRVTKVKESILLNEHDIVGLGNRPCLAGKTKADMLEDIMEVIDRLSSQRRHPLTDAWLVELREKLEVYELGKPAEKK